MAWPTPTLTELQNGYLTEPEVKAISQAARSGTDNPLATALAMTVERVRGMLAQRLGSSIDADTDTVAPEVRHEVYVLARHTALSRFPALAGMLTEARKTEHTEATSRLRKIEEGRISVTAAGADAPAAVGQTAAIVSKSSNRHDRAKLTGLF
jgi:hypothetical protein